MTALGLLMLWLPVLAVPLSVLEVGANVAATPVALLTPHVHQIEAAREMQVVEWPQYSVLSIGVSIAIAFVGMSVARFGARSVRHASVRPDI
jgi:putative Mn2+ efflux pump MntP